MPRDSSGNYTLPIGNPVVSGTVIESNWANTTLGDMRDAMTDSLDRQGRGGMLAPVRGPDGVVSAPAYAFTSDVDTGMWRTTGLLHFAVDGVDVLQIGDSFAQIDGELLVPDAASDGVRYGRKDGVWEADPIQDDAVADGKQYARLDNDWSEVTGTGGGSVTVGETPPPAPNEGEGWWNSSTGRLYTWYIDSAGPGQWVESGPAPFGINQSTGIEEAPDDGQTYGRQGSVPDWNPTYTKTEADAAFAPIAHVGSGGDTEHDLFTQTVAGFVPPPVTAPAGDFLADDGASRRKVSKSERVIRSSTSPDWVPQLPTLAGA